MEEFNSVAAMEPCHFARPRKTLQKEIFISDYDFEETFPAEHKKAFSYNFPTQLKFYINIGYFLFLVPYRISFEGNRYLLKSRLLHKIICGCVYFSIAMYRVCYLIRKFTNGNILVDPKHIFNIAAEITFAIQSMVSLNAFWRKRNGLLAIVNIPRKLPSKKVFVAAVSFCTVSLCYGAYNSQLEVGPMSKYAEFRESAEKYYGVLLFQNKTFSLENMKTEIYVFTVTASVLETFSVVFTMYAEAISLIAALAVYEIMSKFKAFLLPITKWDQNILRIFCISSLYSKTIDDFHSPIYLWTFANIVTYMSSNLMRVFTSEEKMNTRVFIIVGVFYYIFMLCSAAEAYEMSRSCKTLILDLHFNDKNEGHQTSNSSNVAWQLKNIKIGLRGGNFFTVTYPFIGAAVSAVLTYVLVMMQFQTSAIICPCKLTTQIPMQQNNDTV